MLTLLTVCLLLLSQVVMTVRAEESSSTFASDPDFTEELLDQGQRYLDGGDLESAQQVIDEVLQIYPDNVRGLYLSGTLKIRNNQYESGTELIAQAALLEPDNVTYKIALASMYEFLHRDTEALEINNLIIDLTETSSSENKAAQRNVEYIEATLLARNGKFGQARERFAKLSEQYPDDFMIQYSLGIALMFEGNYAQAEIQLIKITELNPSFVNVYDTLATLYERLGRLDQTYAMLDKLVSVNPDGAIADRARVRMDIIEGRLLLAEGNEAEARVVLERAYKLMPDNPEILFNLGVLYEKREEWDRMAAVSEVFVKQYPNRTDVSLRLAKSYVFLGRYEDAVNELERLITVDPQSIEAPEAEIQLQRLMSSAVGKMIASRQRDEKIALIQKQLLDTPDDYAIISELVTLLIQQQRWQEARAPAERLIDIKSASGIAYTSLALIYDKLGLPGLAIKPYAYGISLESNAEVAARIVPALKLVVAKEMYTQGHDSEAIRFLDEILVAEPRNAEALFYSGLVYSRQDLAVKAIDAYQRVLQYMPANVNARLNLALSYHKIKREEDAIEEFRNALQFSTDEQLTEQINAQMQIVEKSIRGFSGGFSFSLAYDNNSNLNNSDPLGEYRTDLSPKIYYRYKAANGLRWLLSTEPVYSSYHNGEFDFLNTMSSVAASISKERITLSSGVSYQVSRGLIDSTRSSNNVTYFGEWLGRYKLPQLFDPKSPDHVLTNLSARASYSDFDSLTSRFFGAYIYAATFGFNQPVDGRTVLNMNYRYSLSDNRYVEGSDYAFRSHGIDLRLERGLTAGIAVNGGLSLTRMNYLYPDSATGYTRYRHNQLRSFYTGLTYQFHPLIRFYTNLSWSTNSTNLPVGAILNAQDVIEGQQSPTLGHYSRFTAMGGVALSL